MKRIMAAVLCSLLLLLTAPASALSAADFTDVSQSDWYYDAVSFVVDKEMFNGTGANTFSPLDTMTRGMFVTVLGRYARINAVTDSSLGIITHSDVNLRSLPTTRGSSVLAVLQTGANVEVHDQINDTSGNGYVWYYVKHGGIMGYIRSDLMVTALNTFTDVDDNAYYRPYVIWAASSYIAAPTGDNTFSPDRAITREEICVMLYNYASLKNLQLPKKTASLSFTDSGSISPDCVSAVDALTAAGVITGRDDGSLLPQSSATRAEVSVMLMRFIDAISYHPEVPPSIDPGGSYVFGTELPQSAAVSSSYFDDACFIGHSLVVGTRDYSGIDNADYLAFNGASSSSLLSSTKFTLETTHTDENGKTVNDTGTLGEALAQKSYGKVYIMVGVNELGTGSYHQQRYYSNMSTLIELVRKSQPYAAVYLISLTPVSRDCSESSVNFNRDNVLSFNGVLKQLCKDKSTYYLNVFDLLADSDGFLPASLDLLGDGIHITASAYRQLASYYYTHTV